MREKIRRRLQQSYNPAALTGDFAVAGVARDPRPSKPAAVLVPLIDHASGMTVLLTRRTAHLVHHAGQVSFPGGRTEAQDKDAVDTALRETEEEIGLSRCYVEIAGLLDCYQTITGFLVTPVVAFVDPGFELQPDPNEVADIFEVPLDFIADTRNHRRESGLFKGQRRYFYVLPYKDYYIWGATAAMLVGFAGKLIQPPAILSPVQD
jgi:8-oxo-dGTP pyrophosphatase MutT (NUDIX family)